MGVLVILSFIIVVRKVLVLMKISVFKTTFLIWFIFSGSCCLAGFKGEITGNVAYDFWGKILYNGDQDMGAKEKR